MNAQKGDSVNDKPDIGSILAECFFALGQSLAGKRVTPGALEFWQRRYHERFTAALGSLDPNVWLSDRRDVLAKARRLGRKAAAIADLTGAQEIDVRHAIIASEANDCRPSRDSDDRIIWCEPTYDTFACLPGSALADRAHRGDGEHSSGLASLA